jgi:hypothetical protein
MSNLETSGTLVARSATLKLTHEGQSPVLTARVPSDISPEEFGHVATGAFDLISKLTGHPCMSGRIKFVVEDLFLNELTRVDLRTGQLQ